MSEYISAAVKQLPDEQRTIVALHYFEGLSLQETATVMGQAVGTVKWRLNKALTRLRSIVDAGAI
jgi:RNA polymerase sigma-70 factor (ECF subfamily)